MKPSLKPLDSQAEDLMEDNPRYDDCMEDADDEDIIEESTVTIDDMTLGEFQNEALRSPC